jgi:hypothetical protein
MPSVIYEKLVNTAGGYFEKEKARTVIERQLARCNATADTFNAEHLKTVMNFVVAATSLYVPDPAKREEMVGNIKKLL